MTIFYTSIFKNDYENLSGGDVNRFILLFESWQKINDCSKFLFGKDVLTKLPKDYNNDIRHVHLAPLGIQDQLEIWNKKLKSKTYNERCNRTSNILVFYTENNKNILLINIGIHKNLSNLDFLHGLGKITENWILKNEII